MKKAGGDSRKRLSEKAKLPKSKKIGTGVRLRRKIDQQKGWRKRYILVPCEKTKKWVIGKVEGLSGFLMTFKTTENQIWAHRFKQRWGRY